jgi:hypothetical protein
MLPGVRARFAPLVLLVVMALAACDGSGSGGDPSSPVRTSPAGSVSGSVPPVTVSHSGPPRPAGPTVPADVPTTGPNLRKPGEKPPVMPLEATQHTQDGAVAFAKFFIQTIDWGFATTSGAYMRHYATKTCTSCAALANGMDAVRAKGNHYLGGRFSVRGAPTIDPDASSTHMAVQFTVDVTSFEEVDARNQFQQGDIAHTGEQFRIEVIWRDSGWRANAFSVRV